jgi:hypothetical protein
VQTAIESNQRIGELIAKIETEQDWKEFTALVEELKGLLGGNPPENKRPGPSI